MLDRLANKLYLTVQSTDIAAAEPICSSNIADAGYSVSESDSIVMSCDVEFSGNLSPAVSCLTNIAGDVVVIDRSQALSRLITYQKLVAVSAGLDDKQLSCSVSFIDDVTNTSLEHNNRSIVDHPRTSFSFNWTSPRIRVIRDGIYTVIYYIMRYSPERTALCIRSSASLSVCHVNARNFRTKVEESLELVWGHSKNMSHFFQSINSFRASLTNSLLIYQCKLNFT